MNKPAREWWIDSVGDTIDNQFDALVCTKDPVVDGVIHVIEYAAVEQLREQLTTIREERKKLVQMNSIVTKERDEWRYTANAINTHNDKLEAEYQTLHEWRGETECETPIEAHAEMDRLENQLALEQERGQRLVEAANKLIEHYFQEKKAVEEHGLRNVYLKLEHFVALHDAIAAYEAKEEIENVRVALADRLCGGLSNLPEKPKTKTVWQWRWLSDDGSWYLHTRLMTEDEAIEKFKGLPRAIVGEPFHVEVKDAE